MAGVGFQLRRLLRRGTFGDLGMAFVYAGTLAAGPWLVTVATLVLLFVFVRPLLGLERFELFSTSVMYAFAGSLILSGPWMMLSTRYAADQMFLRRRDRIPAGVHASLALTAACALVVVGMLAAWSSWQDPEGQALAFRVLVGALLLVVALVWIVLGTVSYARCAGVGLFYQLGVWADKIVLWTLRGHPIGRTPLRALPEYDILTFLAYLSIVPALSYFLIVVETEFFARYRTYLSSVRRGTLLTVWDSEGHLRQALRRGLWRMAEYQAVTTLCLALAAEPILTWLNLSAWSAELFRVLLVAAGFQVLLLTVVLFLLYFELRWEACWVSVLFCVGNFVCTAAVAHGALPWLGMGYAVATGLAFLVGVVWLELKMRRVTFLLFARQPVVD